MKKRILIVEDEPLIAVSVYETLLQNGYAICGIAKNYDEALSLAGNGLPDLVLLDINIHGDKDGITLAEDIKKLYNIPLLFVTGYTDRTDKERIKKIVPAGHISKPVKKKDLLSAVEMALNTE